MQRRRKRSTAKYKNPSFEKGTCYLPKTMTHKIRIYATTTKIEISHLVKMTAQEFMEKHLSRIQELQTSNCLDN